MKRNMPARIAKRMITSIEYVDLFSFSIDYQKRFPIAWRQHVLLEDIPPIQALHNPSSSNCAGSGHFLEVRYFYLQLEG